MAQIDLRHADVYVKDGYTATGAVNQPSSPGPAPANGDTQVTVDGFSKAIPVGNTLHFTGIDQTYTVTSTTGGTTPTVINFTPALATAKGIPADNCPITIGPNILRVKMGDGNLTYSEKRNVEYVREKRRIDLGYIRAGDEEPTDVSIDGVWEFLSSDSGEPPTFEEALKQEGAATNWETSGSDPCELYSIDLEIVYSPPCLSTKGETITLHEFRWESIDHDMKAGTFAVRGKCKILTPTKARKSQPILLPY